MAELFISAIVEGVLSKITSLAYKEASLAFSIKNDIEKLAGTLIIIKAVLKGAEEKQSESHNDKFKVWLEKLKEVCYDAEDVLDEFGAEVLHRQVVNRRSFTKKVHNFFSSSNPLVFRFKMGHKIKEIRVRLDEIAAEKNNFDLTEKIDNKHFIIGHRETHSFVIASEVIGRDLDKEKIIKLLMQHSEVENVSVIPIVGIGGVGKTALAKLVYNDERVDECFDLKMWVCVSDDFDLKQVIKKIVQLETNMDYSNLNVEQLQRMLQEKLRGRKYLLVLDDAWNAIREKWIELKSLLMGGACGTNIIVTTRSHQVASIMGTVSTYMLGVLPNDVCISLFNKCAFREGEEHQHPNLMKIGEEIMKKCGGIPLAVRTLGSLLYSSTDENAWKLVRDNEIWKLQQNENDILPALKLSYDQLPSHLKQCFVYCSIFPKDYEFTDYQLVDIWKAQGLLQSPNGNEEPGTLGMLYVKELVSRSFFQDFEVAVDLFRFKMHDLIHDLATLMADGECVVVNSSRQLVSKKARHLSFVGPEITEDEDIVDFLSKLDCHHVRTIYFTYFVAGHNQQFVESSILRFQFLRMLVVNGSNIEVLPNKIGNLKHLRYLSLQRCFKIKRLPTSICKLQNLEALFLNECYELEELPRDIRDLIGLKAFSFSSKQKCLRENEIGCLNSLQYLAIDGCVNLEYLFEDIGRLEVLQKLVITRCPNLMVLPRGMKHLSSLQRLIIRKCEKLDLDFGMKKDADDDHEINGGVRAHLQTLDIMKSQLEQLPQWLLKASANTLQHLTIVHCPNFVALPDSLQNLKSLQILQIWGCPKLTCLPENMQYLTALKNLVIGECPTLSERCKRGTGEDWPKIAHIPQIQIDE